MAKQDDGLFLLEVLIDKIVFVKSPCFSDKDFRTCVTIECPAVEPLEICDDDPGACVAKSGGPFVKTFNSGKSCLFSLQEADINKAMSNFPVKVSVYKSLPCGCLPTKIVMGEATIDMTKEFVQSRKKFLEDPTNVSYEALKDTFRIVGPDSTETGEVVMFLRISCFGKLIITRFQGASGPPKLGTGQGPSIVDRSCNPLKEFQTTQDPCVCGAAQTAAGSRPPDSVPCNAPCRTTGSSGYGVCPIARDPYNSMPCEDPDDPCYCSGPKAPPKQQMICRNTDPYCLHVPKGALPSLPIYQDLTEEQIRKIKSTSKELQLLHVEDRYINLFNAGSSIPCSETTTTFTIDEYLQSFPDKMKFSTESIDYSATSLCAIRAKRRSVSFSAKVDYVSKSYSHFSNYRKKYDSDVPKTLFGKKETVYMTLFNDFCRRRTSGTQATASINKCLQVCPSTDVNSYYIRNCSDSNNCSTCNTSTLNCQDSRRQSMQDSRRQYSQDTRIRYSDVYFFGKKRNDNNTGMGLLKRKRQNVTAAQVQNDDIKYSAQSIQAASQNSTTGAQTKRGGSTNGKLVSIRENRCPATNATKGDMMATVSHIRIGPREPCPVHGREPCQGPKCIVATSGADDQVPVKVSTMTNPRRGVFELVIRRMNGAPLARNELMLEWTPPPVRPPTCGSPCATPCATPCVPPGPPCQPSRYKMIVCRPSPCRPPRCYKKPCKKPCGPILCRNTPCKKCCRPSCCGKPCRSCKPCKPCKPPKPCTPCPPSPRCRPCPPPSCKTPCGSPCGPPCGPACCQNPCTSPCKSSPCLRPCPIGYRRPRKFRSQPKIKAHRKLISPCLNRSKACPVVRCRSVPGPCVGCCSIPPCPPRKCCSVFPCPPRKCYPTFPCSPRKCCLAPCPPHKCCSASRYKLPKCCKSKCTSCCP